MLRLEKSASKRRRSPRKSRRRAGSPGKCAGSSPPTSRRHAHSDTGHKTIRSTADRSAARTKARSSRHIPCRPLPLFSSQYNGFPRCRQAEKNYNGSVTIFTRPSCLCATICILKPKFWHNLIFMHFALDIYAYLCIMNVSNQTVNAAGAMRRTTGGRFT